MRKAQNPRGNRGGVGKRAMRRAEEQQIETAQRDQFGREQNRDLAPQQRPAKNLAHSALFLARLDSAEITTAKTPPKAVDARITTPTNQAPPDMSPLLLLNESGFCHGAAIPEFDGFQFPRPKFELFE
jgi:hypothetical protein